MRLSGVVGDRSLVSDEVWAVIGPLSPAWKGNGRPVADRRLVVEGTAWKFRTGAPWRDLPEHFGNWNTVFRTSTAGQRMALGQESSNTSRPAPKPLVILTGSHRSTPRSCASISMARPFRASRGPRRIT